MAAFEAARFNHSRTSPRAVALAGVASTFSLAKVAEGVILLWAPVLNVNDMVARIRRVRYLPFSLAVR